MQGVIAILLEAVILPLLAVCLLHSLLNMVLLRRLMAVPLPNHDQGEILPVSVLVPARNEERCIRACLTSLINQQPSVREILLLDDRSSDATVPIARELGFLEGNGHRLRLIHGRELPAGWVGKNWACHQLSVAADERSTHLLFTDADTIHGATCVWSALHHAKQEGTDLLSLWPDQITVTWSEKLIIPMLYLLAMVFQPLAYLLWLQECPERVRRKRLTPRQLSNLGAANGQFLLFRREAYRSIGGHEALKDHLVEDVAFGRRIAARTGEGMRLRNADGGELLRCRMYSDFREVWEGFSKNIRPVFEESLPTFLFVGSVLSILFLAPFLLLPLTLWFRGITIPTLIAVSLILLIRLALTLRFRTSWLSLIAHPVGVALALLIGLNSWRLCLGEGVSWKGRTYQGSTRSSVE